MTACSLILSSLENYAVFVECAGEKGGSHCSPTDPDRKAARGTWDRGKKKGGEVRLENRHAKIGVVRGKGGTVSVKASKKGGTTTEYGIVACTRKPQKDELLFS